MVWLLDHSMLGTLTHLQRLYNGGLQQLRLKLRPPHRQELQRSQHVTTVPKARTIVPARSNGALQPFPVDGSHNNQSHVLLQRGTIGLTWRADVPASAMVWHSCGTSFGPQLGCPSSGLAAAANSTWARSGVPIAHHVRVMCKQGAGRRSWLTLMSLQQVLKIRMNTSTSACSKIMLMSSYRRLD
jgi:hypothetical protein